MLIVLLAECCSLIAVSGYCHNMSSVVMLSLETVSCLKTVLRQFFSVLVSVLGWCLGLEGCCLVNNTGRLLSVVTLVNCDKTAEDRIMQYLLKCSPLPQLFACQI